MAVCEFKISEGIGITACNNMPFQGLRQTAYIMNKSDVTFALDASKPLVTALNLASGAKAYRVLNMGRQPFNGTSTTMNANDTGINDFNKVVAILVQENSITNASTVEALANGSFVIVIENEWKSGDRDNGWEIIGLQRGCRATEISENKYEGGGTACTLTEENASAFKYFLSLEGESEDPVEATRLALEALCGA